MFRFYGSISLSSLMLFAAVHAAMRFTGQSSADILLIHEGLVAIMATAGIISAVRHGVPFWSFVILMIVVALSCGISVLGIYQPEWATAVGIAFVCVIAVLLYRKWYHTPYGENAGWFSVSTSRFGDVMPDPAGHPRRDVDTEVDVLRHPPEK